MSGGLEVVLMVASGWLAWLAGYGLAKYLTRDRPSQSSSVTSLHFWHRWTVWSDPVTVKYERKSLLTFGEYGTYTWTAGDDGHTKADTANTVTYDEQYRHCQTCKLAQMRRV